MATTQVVIKTSELNTYAQIMRAAISGANACAKIDRERAQEFLELLHWAEQRHASLVSR